MDIDIFYGIYIAYSCKGISRYAYLLASECSFDQDSYNDKVTTSSEVLRSMCGAAQIMAIHGVNDPYPLC
jgi:hypothetical protein